MSKELEALKIGIPKLKKLYENSAKKMSQNDILGFDLVFVYLDKALQRLEAIDNANPSEALKYFNIIENEIPKTWGVITKEGRYMLDTIKSTVIKAQEQEKVLNTIKNYIEVGIDYGNNKDVSIALVTIKTNDKKLYVIDQATKEISPKHFEKLELLKRYFE